MVLNFNLMAQVTKPEKNKFPKESWGVGVHPIIGVSDTDGLTLGAAMAFYFEPEDRNQDTDELGSSISFNFSRQYDILLDYSKYFKDNWLSLDLKSGYQNYPDDYNDMDYNAEYIPFRIAANFVVSENTYIGVSYSFKFSKTSFVNNETANSTIIGVGKKCLSGLGGQLVYKNIPKGQIYRREGNLFKVSFTHFNPALGSSLKFTESEIDYRHYFPVWEKCVLAFQIVGKSSFGDVPFYDILELKGKMILRGASSMSGNYFLAGQTELRFPVWWRFGATVFAGMGEVEENLSDFCTRKSVAGGIGLRIVLNKKKNINLRFDFAFNEEGSKSVVMKIKEAF